MPEGLSFWLKLAYMFCNTSIFEDEFCLWHQRGFLFVSKELFQFRAGIRLKVFLLFQEVVPGTVARDYSYFIRISTIFGIIPGSVVIVSTMNTLIITSMTIPAIVRAVSLWKTS